MQPQQSDALDRTTQLPGTPGRLRIVLLSPKGPLYRHRTGIFPWYLRYQPLTLPTLAALVPRELDAEVVCIDEGVSDIDPNLEADLVGMTVITGNATRAYELADCFRRRGVPVVLGGPHVTLVPEDARPHADAIVCGYAEQTWPQLLHDLVAGRLQPRYDQAPRLTLGGRPAPDRSVLPRLRYVTRNVFEATRGCNHSCDFCVVPTAWGRPLSYPVEEVVERIRRQGCRRVTFVDLNLIADREYAARLFAALVPLGIQWYGLSTTLLCDDAQLLDLAARSGCRGLLLGFESLTRSSLRSAGKGFNRPQQYPRMVEQLHKRGIAIQACFVFGNDGDTLQSIDATARFAVDCGIDLPRFAVLTPFPGTPLFGRLAAEGRILTRSWELYDGQHAVFEPAQMSAAELDKATRQAWRYAYSARSIWRRLRHSAAPLPVAVATNLGYRHYAHRLARIAPCTHQEWGRSAAVERRAS